MVRIITDSAADLEPREYEALNVTCIPLPVSFGQEEYQENVNLSKEQFYDLLEKCPDFPKTSQASPQILLDLFEEAEKAGDEAVYITLSSGLSGTYQTAQMTQSMTEGEGCYVVDSRNGTGGQRLLVEYAAALRDQGRSGREIVEALEEVRGRVVLYACMDTMENLYRGGRLSRTAYKLGTLANVKPMIHLNADGAIEVPAKAMGMRRGIDQLSKYLQQRNWDEAFPIYLMYTRDRANAEALAEKLRTAGYEIPQRQIVNVGAAIGSHIGPGACGIVFVEKAE